MSDQSGLSARVVAALDHLGQAEDERRQMSGRLLELVNGVEAALARKQAQIDGYLATIESLRGENTELRDLLDRLLGCIEQAGESRVGEAVASLGSALSSLTEGLGGDAQAAEHAAAGELADDLVDEAAADPVDEAAMADDAMADEVMAEAVSAEEAAAEARPIEELEAAPADDSPMAAEALAAEADASPAQKADQSADEDLDLGDLAAAAETDDGEELRADQPETELPAEAVEADVDVLAEQRAETASEERAAEPVDAEAMAEDTSGSDEAEVDAASAAEAAEAVSDGASDWAAGDGEPGTTQFGDALDSLPPGDPARVKAIIERVSRLADEMAETMRPGEAAEPPAKPRSRKAAAS